EVYLIHNRKCQDCRITSARARLAAGTLVVDLATARELRLMAGAQVRAVRLMP
ncbi:MAG TPA: arginine N-succinyltransferase, partial [Pseudomonas sp.]|nr:arginine N-succinyltransferase [Pseudomonas sp.]